MNDFGIQEISEVIPFLLFVLYLFFPNEFISGSNCILGKFFAVLLIVFYSNIHIIYGIFVCTCIILYYQSDYIVTMFELYEFQQKEHFENLEKSHPDLSEKTSIYETDHIQKLSTSPFARVETPSIKTDSSKFGGNASNLTTQLTRFEKAYPYEIPPVQRENEAFLKHNYCTEDLELVYNHSKIIHPENIQHIFPEVNFSDRPCNICDKNCSFEIKSEHLDKIILENELKSKPTRGNADILEWATSFFINKNEPFQGVGQNTSASYL